jgi:hypothetical protein
MIIRIIFLKIIIFLVLAGCSEHAIDKTSVKIGDRYMPDDKKYWEEIIFSRKIEPLAEIKLDNISYIVSFDTNFVIYYIRTDDPDFSTSERVSPGMSYSKIREVIKEPRIESIMTSDFDLFRTNKPENLFKIFNLQLRSGWHALFHGKYDKMTIKPDDNDYIDYMYKGELKSHPFQLNAMGDVK